MKFPINVIKIEDKIVLLQSYISEEFLNVIRELRSNDVFIANNGGFIRTATSPELRLNGIYLNGGDRELDYQIKTIKYDQETFDFLKTTIQDYKVRMGYDE